MSIRPGRKLTLLVFCMLVFQSQYGLAGTIGRLRWRHNGRYVTIDYEICPPLATAAIDLRLPRSLLCIAAGGRHVRPYVAIGQRAAGARRLSCAEPASAPDSR